MKDGTQPKDDLTKALPRKQAATEKQNTEEEQDKQRVNELYL